MTWSLRSAASWCERRYLIECFAPRSEVVLVDLPPDELLDRLRQGKVYLPEQAARALERFFRRENLVALREIALGRRPSGCTRT